MWAARGAFSALQTLFLFQPSFRCQHEPPKGPGWYPGAVRRGRFYAPAIGPCALPEMNWRTTGSSQARISSGVPEKITLPWKR